MTETRRRPEEPGRGQELIPAAIIPDGPVNLWVAVLDGDGQVMGAAPARTSASWLWRDGRLCLGYGETAVVVTRPGRRAFGLICAVSPAMGTFRPMWRIRLGPRRDMPAGSLVAVPAGEIALIPDHR